jgi:hypothetical protein
VREYSYDAAEQAVEMLDELSRKVEIPAMVRLMKDIVPEFLSKNSRFEEFDNK